ncbi:type I secretion system permease/ATPase [Frigidibacter sp. RF13]|uniref:type I secretion system permease/ATPase n=1 Tax=Frigidibacter sp. RF13 TaxID=2997340 RepID=UPI00226F723F|nr:type I secretion system permease/ATPase [Frigidibacter sp. RF13]MCY1128430.1 type I secretion system permease/ATPase [Frigidibacter sp. RF13]
MAHVNPVPNLYREALTGLRRTFVFVGLFSACVNILMLTGSLFMMQVYDRVLGSGSVPTLIGLLAIVVVLYAFLAFYDFLRVRFLSRAAYRLDRQLGNRGFELWIQTALSGNPALRRPLNDLATIRGFMTGPAMLGFLDLPWVPFYLLIVSLIHPWLGLLTIFGALVVTVLAIAGQFLTDAAYKRAMGMDAAESFFVEQCYRTAETIQAMGMSGRIGARWRKMHDEGLWSHQRGGDKSEILSAASKAFRMLLQSAVLALGAYLAIRQEVSPGLMLAISVISGKALAPIDQVIGQWRAIVKTREAHRRLTELLAAPAAAAVPIELPEPTGQIAVRGLTKFAPGQRNRAERPPVLSDVTFQLEAGEGLGVIGSSASGKSTLARLLVGSWAADSGEIRLDGAALPQWSAEQLGRYIGYLPQQVELLSGTIRDNICRFDPEAKDEDIVAVAKLTGVHEMILSLPQGYGTEIGFSGFPLSGGQVQRIGLARALFGSPKIVILDEPNSNLDAAGDEALAKALLDMRARGTTVILMAHRPSALAAVGKVLVLQGGQVRHFGDRDEVLAQATRPAGHTGPAVIRRMQDAG